MATRTSTKRGTSTRKMVTVHGIDSVLAELKAVSRNLDRDLEDALDDAAEIVQVDAKRRAPVADDSHHGFPPGTLRREIIRDIRIEGFRKPTARVGPSKKAWYGLFPEVGTRHHAATPYLRPALDENVRRIEEKMIDSFRGSIRRAVT